MSKSTPLKEISLNNNTPESIPHQNAMSLDKKDRLIPQKSENIRQLPPLSTKSRDISEQALTPTKELKYRRNDADLTPKPLIPVKTPSRGHDTDSPSLEQSSIPLLTPPGSRKVYDTIQAPQRSVSTPISGRKPSLGRRRMVSGSVKPFRSPLSGRKSIHRPKNRNISKEIRRFSRVHDLNKRLDDEIKELNRKKGVTKSFLDLKLDDSATLAKDVELVEKWQNLVSVLSNEALDVYKAKILSKYASFKDYKLSRYNEYRKNLKWKMMNGLEEKYQELTSSEKYESMSEYEKKSLEKEFESAKSELSNDIARECDAKFREMFGGVEGEPNRGDVVSDEFEVDDLYSELGLVGVRIV